MSKSIEEIRKILQTHKEELHQMYQVKEIGIFGSFVTGEFKETSDVDILVEFWEPVGLIKFVKLKNYLSDLLGVYVDLVMKRALKPRISRRILAEVVYV
jgi:uncharacterized protein